MPTQCAHTEARIHTHARTHAQHSTPAVVLTTSFFRCRQAVLASDFAICEFRHLARLLLLHGHNCYARMCHAVLE